MDNLTHSLIGLAVGELVQRSLAPEPDHERQSTRRGLLLFACWVASNFPDLDLFLTPLISAPLGYLLHHRGHTHTLLYAIPQAFLLWAMLWLCWPSARKLLSESGSARMGLVVTVVLGLVLHLLMDYLNSYGIHPFHPFDSRWLYGDMVFILEPVFWIAFGMPLLMTLRRTGLKALIAGLMLGVLVFFTIRGFLLWPSLIALVLLAIAIVALQRTSDSRGKSALITGIVLSMGFVGMQGLASNQAKLSVAQMLQAQAPASEVLDASMSAFPTNPFCWSFVSIERDDAAGTYALRRGVLSLAPAVLPVAGCPASLAEGVSQAQGTTAIVFVSQEQGNLESLRKMKNENCHFEAWLRFARAPSLNETEASDSRFGSSMVKNFSSFNFADFKNRECSRFIPGWDFPRADLLAPAAAGLQP
ncbi:MAG: metal-dependent hydrolase [Pseudomonadota bacterium]